MATRTMLIIEDDDGLAKTLAYAFDRRGYTSHIASSAEEGIMLAKEIEPGFVLVDLKLPGRTGLDCVAVLAQRVPQPRIVVLTGFASINTAVEAIKLGACHYLAKPATATEIDAAFDHRAGDASIQLTNRRANLKTMEWERIQQTLREADFNISEAARRLGMHRRTLARKLAKQQVN